MIMVVLFALVILTYLKQDFVTPIQFKFPFFKSCSNVSHIRHQYHIPHFQYSSSIFVRAMGMGVDRSRCSGIVWDWACWQADCLLCFIDIKSTLT